MWLLMPITFSGYGHNECKNILARSLVVAGRILLMRLGADDFDIMDGLVLVSRRVYCK